MQKITHLLGMEFKQQSCKGFTQSETPVKYNNLHKHFPSRIPEQDQVDSNISYQALMVKTATNSNNSRFSEISLDENLGPPSYPSIPHTTHTHVGQHFRGQ